jgi:hypothetical protein
VTSLPHTGKTYRAEISPDGRRVVTGSDDGSFVWDIEKGAVLLELARKHQEGYSMATVLTWWSRRKATMALRLAVWAGNS